MSKRDGRLKKIERCEQCGRRMRRTIVDRYEYKESGLSGIYLHGIAVYVCQCGEEVVELPKIDRLHDLIFQKLLMKPSSLTGSELRFIRKSLGLKAADFAAMVSVTATTVSRWETDAESIGSVSDKLIRIAATLTATAKIKAEVENIYRRISDQYLDFLNGIKDLSTRESTNQMTVDITEDELERSSLTFRYGLVPTVHVEVT